MIFDCTDDGFRLEDIFLGRHLVICTDDTIILSLLDLQRKERVNPMISRYLVDSRFSGLRV